MAGKKYKGKFSSPRTRVRKQNARGRRTGRASSSRILSVVLVFLALLGASTGAVAAYLSYTTSGVYNSFTPAGNVTQSVTISGDSASVTVTAPGYGVYVRAAVLVNWKDSADGAVHMDAPAYSVSPGENWALNNADGYYYYSQVVTDTQTLTPVKSYSVSSTAPDGYEKNLEVIVQTIQAVGYTDTGNTPAVDAAWPSNPFNAQ